MPAASKTRALVLATAVALLSFASPARALDPLNSRERTEGEKPPQGHDELTVVPVVGGSSDIGVGGGFFAGLTRNKQGYDPFVWHIEAAGFLSGAVDASGVRFPYADLYSKLTVTRFLGGPLQLEVRPSITDELALYYYGLGNASSATPPSGRTNGYFEYARAHPELLTDLRFKIVDHVAGKVGLRYIETWYQIPSDSKLAADLESGSPEVKKLLGPTGAQGDALFRYGLEVDTRDNQVSPHSGTFDEASFNLSPGGTRDLPFRYGEASLNLRGYVPLGSPRFTLALRAIGQVLFGDVPFYELSRAVDTFAIGGSNGVRGVPAQRYYGKVKAFGNVELRGKLVDFHLFGKPFSLGGATFFDAGRVWADTSPHPELDGRSFGLKYGIGAGLRLYSGTAFVLRGDLAWSPDAMPIGGYLVAGESF